MYIHLRCDERNAEHIKFTVFMNSANCGQLCMRVGEAMRFRSIIERDALEYDIHSFKQSGDWGDDK
jgi:hypothetical protein